MRFSQKVWDTNTKKSYRIEKFRDFPKMKNVQKSKKKLKIKEKITTVDVPLCCSRKVLFFDIFLISNKHILLKF